MVRINLLPVRVSKKKEAGKQQLILFAVLLVAGLVFNYLWAAQRAGVLSGIRAGIEKERADIAGLERIIGEVKNIRAQQDQLKQKLDVLDKLKAGRTGPVKMLDELATVTPKRLWLKKMEEKGGTAITFEGTAATIDDVSAFMAALRSSKHFGNVELKKTAATAARGAPIRLVDFTITTSVTYGGLVAQATGPGAPGSAPGAPPTPAR
jgi:type IV pilus assembly protein PilN